MIEFDPGCAKWIKYQPRWAIEPYKKPDFSLFQSDRVVIVIDDPGLDWPGDPAVKGRSPASLEKHRLVLASDNRVYVRSAVIAADGAPPNPGYER
ncbi:MAG: hypothetical protein IBJ11_09530 [Phycisphaerales bacterium]|nr:hypothetical protein [Phycisphaerales bacterium]